MATSATPPEWSGAARAIWGLAFRLWAVVMVVMALTFWLLAEWTGAQLRSQHAEVQTERFLQVARDLVLPLEAALALGLPLQQIPRFQDLLEREETLAGALSIEVYDTQGRILFGTDRSFIGDLVAAHWLDLADQDWRFQGLANQGGANQGGANQGGAIRDPARQDVAPQDPAYQGPAGHHPGQRGLAYQAPLPFWSTDDPDANVLGLPIRNSFGNEVGTLALRYAPMPEQSGWQQWLPNGWLTSRWLTSGQAVVLAGVIVITVAGAWMVLIMAFLANLGRDLHVSEQILRNSVPGPVVQPTAAEGFVAPMAAGTMAMVKDTEGKINNILMALRQVDSDVR